MGILQSAFNEMYYISAGMMHSTDGSQLESGLVWTAAALGVTALIQGIAKSDKIEIGAAGVELGLALHRFRGIGEHYKQRQWAAEQQESTGPDEPNKS